MTKMCSITGIYFSCLVQRELDPGLCYGYTGLYCTEIRFRFKQKHLQTLGWCKVTDPCCCCWAVWDRTCRWIARADRRPAPARTRPLSPPQTSSSQSTWGRWWWRERPQTLDWHQWRSHRQASPSLSSWTAGSGRGRPHQALKTANAIQRHVRLFTFQSVLLQ